MKQKKLGIICRYILSESDKKSRYSYEKAYEDWLYTHAINKKDFEKTKRKAVEQIQIIYDDNVSHIYVVTNPTN